MVKFSKLAMAAALVACNDSQVDARRYLHNDDFALRRLAQNSNDLNINSAIGTVKSPLVEATDCTKMCIFYDNMGN